MGFPKSVGLLFLGVLKRFYYFAPSLFSDPFDISERWFKVIYEPPQWLFWLLLCLGILMATALAYHEIRMQKINLEHKLDDKAKKREIREKLGGVLEQGQTLKCECANAT